MKKTVLLILILLVMLFFSITTFAVSTPTITGSTNCTCGEACDFQINSNNSGEIGYELWWQYYFSDGTMKEYCANWNNKQRCNSDSEYRGEKSVWTGYLSNSLYSFNQNIFDIEDKNISTVKLWVMAWNKNSEKSSWSDVYQVEINCASYEPFKLFYVSSQGQDTYDGTFDYPFKTLEKARDEIRKINIFNKNVKVIIKDPFFKLENTFNLTSEDSGKNGYYVIYSGNNTILSGGEEFRDWQKEGNLLKTFVGDINSRNLYINGVRATRAKSDGSMGLTLVSDGYAHNTNMDTWKNKKDIEIVSSKLWRQIRCGASNITSNKVIIQEPCWSNSLIGGGSNPIWVENAFELLDQSGEWYLNKSSGWLYYYPIQNQNETNIVATIPKTEKLILGVGTISKPIQNIVFENLSFAYSVWNGTSDNSGFPNNQADVYRLSPTGISSSGTGMAEIPGSVQFENSERIIFRKNIFSRIGSNGLVFEKYSKSSIIEDNFFYDISAIAIRLGNITYNPGFDSGMKTRYNVVKLNYITNVGLEYQSAPGIMVGYGRKNYIFNNELYSLPYSGISIGWGWGVTDSIKYDLGENFISRNRIDQAVQILSDGGSIYSLGNQPGTIINENYITRQGKEYGAIYLDEGSSSMTIENNILFENKRSLLIKGSNHIFRNNLWQNRGSINNLPDLWFYDGTPLTENNHVITAYSQINSSLLTNIGISSAKKAKFETDLTKSYVFPIQNIPQCISFTYSDWAPITCPQNGIQTRTETLRNPTGCTSTPILTQSCTPQNPICYQTTETVSNEEFNTYKNQWRNGNLTLIQIIQKSKLKKYCN